MQDHILLATMQRPNESKGELDDMIKSNNRDDTKRGRKLICIWKFCTESLAYIFDENMCSIS